MSLGIKTFRVDCAFMRGALVIDDTGECLGVWVTDGRPIVGFAGDLHEWWRCRKNADTMRVADLPDGQFAMMARVAEANHESLPDFDFGSDSKAILL